MGGDALLPSSSRHVFRPAMVDPSEAEDGGKSKSPGLEAPSAASEAPGEPEPEPEAGGSGGGEGGPQRSPKLHLDLYNFDSPDAEGSRYVLTSPRSLEACARCGVRPVELLPRPLVDFAREAPGRSPRGATGLFEAFETERQVKLKKCREERERILREDRRRLLLGDVASGGAASAERSLATAGAGHPSKILHTSTTSGVGGTTSGVGGTTSGVGGTTPPPPLTPSKPTTSPCGKTSKSVPAKLPSSVSVLSPTLLAAMSAPAKKAAHTFPRSASKATSSLPRASASLSAPGPCAPVSAAPFDHFNGFAASRAQRREKSHSLESLQRRKEQTCSSTTTRTSSESGASSSYSWEGPRDRWFKASSPRARTLATFNSLMGRSLSLGDLSHSPQTTQKVERIVKEVKRRGLNAVPERDRKIAALMLARYQEEDIMSQTRYVAHLQWDSERRLEELRREREEREKQRAVLQCQRAWHSQVTSRQQRLSQQEQEAAAVKLRQAAESEERRRELAEQQERSRTQRLRQAAREEKQKKDLQEQNLRALEEERAAMLEQERLLLQEKLSTAELKRQEREHQVQEERRGLNRAERRRHTALLREIARRETEERKLARRSLEDKLSRSSENYEQIMERRGLELREKARREEKQIQKARQAAEQRERQQQEQLEGRLKEAERRAQQAAVVAEERAKEKALRAVMSRQEKEKLQRVNRRRVEEEEQQRRQELLQSIERKLEKSEQIFREKRAVLESARSMARASFHVRDRVREETNMRTFDKMALEAKLKASLDEK
ncbi:Reticulocyte-binding protein 2-like [Arapaima gigas]